MEAKCPAPGSREGFHRAAGSGSAVLWCGVGSGVCDPPAPVSSGSPGGEEPLVPAWMVLLQWGHPHRKT